MDHLDHLLEQELGEALPEWKMLQKEILTNHSPSYHNNFKSLNYYDLIHVVCKKDGTYYKEKRSGKKLYSLLILTNPTLLNRIDTPFTSEEIGPFHTDYHLKKMMLGRLLEELEKEKSLTTIKVNPQLKKENDQKSYFCEEILFAPIFDTHTEKLMTTDPDEAGALLAINPEDHKDYGIEFIFHVLTNKNLPSHENRDRDEREKILREHMEKLAFVLPRIPMKKGSASLFCIILNLENSLEESAFIRTYRTLDQYSGIIFVTSDLKIYTGELETISYSSETIDGIFQPLINWQKRNQRTSI